MSLSLREPPLHQYLRYALLGLLVWLPLPLGSNRAWSNSLFILLIGAITALWVISRLNQSRLQPDSDCKVTGHPYSLAAVSLLLLLVATQLWVMIQWVFALSSDIGETFRYGLLGIGYTLLFWLVISLFSLRAHLTLLLSTLVVSGAFQAFFGAFMVLSGTEWLLFQPKEHYQHVVTGTFVNRNHLAGYLEMTIPCAIGLMLALRDGRAFNWHNTLELLLSPKLLLRLAIVIMVIALVMSQSRMGNTGFFASLLVVGSLYVLINKQHRLRNTLILVSLIAIDLLVISQFFGLENLKNRLEQTHLQTVMIDGEVVQQRTDRLDVAEYVLPQIKDRPITGFGAGTFESTFQQYAGPDIHLDFDHAHNDYLQFLVEFGLVGTVLLGLFVLISLYQAFKALWRRESWYRSGVGFGAAMGILALMIHALTDFNHQIPANAATFVVLCAVAVLANHHVHGDATSTKHSKTRRRRKAPLQ